MSSDTTFENLLAEYNRRIINASKRDTKEAQVERAKRANRKFLEELTAYVNSLEQLDVNNKKKIREYKNVKKFMEDSIEKILSILDGKLPPQQALELMFDMNNDLKGLYDEIGIQIAELKPPVEVTDTPIASARIMTPDRTTQDTNIKTGGAISGFVGRVREMFQGPEVKSKNPIPEASKIPVASKLKTNDIPVAELITAIPMPPTGERPSGRSFRADRIPVTNFGGGGAAPEENKDEE
jgi:hypothetical protein